jgi:hypothetical protein
MLDRYLTFCGLTEAVRSRGDREFGGKSMPIVCEIPSAACRRCGSEDQEVGQRQTMGVNAPRMIDMNKHRHAAKR